MEDEAHGYDFHNELKSEDCCKEEATIKDKVVIAWMKIEVFCSVVVQHKNNRIAQNEEENRVFKPPPRYQPH